MTHWQHLAATPEAVDRAVRLKEAGSISPHDIRFLRWVKSAGGHATVGRVLKDYFKADFRDSWRYQEAKTLLESLAFCGYLLRGRQHANLKDPRVEGSRCDFAYTTYRLSKEAHALSKRGRTLPIVDGSTRQNSEQRSQSW